MERNEWHSRPNDWHSVGESARWNDVVKRFEVLNAESARRLQTRDTWQADGLHPAINSELVAKAVIRDGLAVIAAAKMAYPAQGAPPSRPGLGKVTEKRARDVRGRIAKELAYAEHDLSGEDSSKQPTEWREHGPPWAQRRAPQCSDSLTRGDQHGSGLVIAMEWNH